MNGNTRRSALRDIAVLAILVLLPQILPIHRAGAASNNCGNYGRFFVGALVDKPGKDYDGAKADIEIRDVAHCPFTGLNRFSAAWVMVARLGDSQIGYAQVGYIDDCDTLPGAPFCRRFFWQWKNNTGSDAHTAYWGEPQLGNMPEFKVAWQSGDGHLHMYHNGGGPPCNQQGFCPETNFNPYSAWPRMGTQFMGEMSYPGEDLVGKTDSKADWDHMKSRKPNGQWDFVDWDARPNARPCYYNVDIIAQDEHYKTWTQPLNHGTQC